MLKPELVGVVTSALAGHDEETLGLADFCELLDASVENLVSEGGPTAHLFAPGERGGGSETDAKLVIVLKTPLKPEMSCFLSVVCGAEYACSETTLRCLVALLPVGRAAVCSQIKHDYFYVARVFCVHNQATLVRSCYLCF